MALIIVGYLVLSASAGFMVGRLDELEEMDRGFAVALCALFAPLGFPLALAWTMGEWGNRRLKIAKRAAERAEEIALARHKLDLAALDENTAEIRRLGGGR